jgi:hypothetical protein
VVNERDWLCVRRNLTLISKLAAGHPTKRWVSYAVQVLVSKTPDHCAASACEACRHRTTATPLAPAAPAAAHARHCHEPAAARGPRRLLSPALKGLSARRVSRPPRSASPRAQPRRHGGLGIKALRSLPGSPWRMQVIAAACLPAAMVTPAPPFPRCSRVPMVLQLGAMVDCAWFRRSRGGTGGDPSRGIARRSSESECTAAAVTSASRGC